MKKSVKCMIAAALTAGMLASMGMSAMAEDFFPVADTVTLTGMISYPDSTESDPNNRTIFKRLEEKSNVHIEWTAIPNSQWGEKIQTQMSNPKTMTDFIFTAGFSDSDLLRYGDFGAIIPLNDYITPEIMPNLSTVFEKYPEYKAMTTDPDGNIWSFPWIEQLGSGKEAIQSVGDMPFINKAWLDFLGLEVPGTVDDFKNVLIAFRDNADQLSAEFGIDGSIIPMSCIMNDGNQDPALLINGFGEGYGDCDQGRHIAVTNDGQVISTATTEGFKKGMAWLHELYAEGLIDQEAFTQDWSTYVSKGKSGRYGVCFSWDVANIVDNFNNWIPLPALEADTKNITAENESYTSGYDRGRCVVTAVADDPEMVCRWIDLMYDPFQSPQNNWGTYGEDDDFDIFELGENENGEQMLKHAPLGDASPVEVREAENVAGPLAVLDEYYGVYVTCPDDAQYRLDWIKNIYTPDMHNDNVYPNVFMSQEDTEQVSNLEADLTKTINAAKSDWVMNGFDDADWDQFQSDLEAYGLSEYLEIMQKYYDAYVEAEAE